jgi:hypothetical protein
VNGSEDTARLVRSLASFADLPIRVSWLRDQVGRLGPTAFATTLEGILSQAQAGQGQSRQALLACAIWLVVDRKSPALSELAREAERSALLGLSRLLAPPRAESIPAPAEDARAVTDGAGRELTVGERRSLARRPSRRQLERLLSDPHPLVLETLFQCPTLTEGDVLRVITKRPARLVAIEAVADSPRWLARPTVRVALIQNPGSPQNITLPLLATCLKEDLVSVLEATSLDPVIRNAARETLLRLPPLTPTSGTLH